MILLKFKKGQGLGNQLWNYVVLRSIADLNNFKFKIIDYKNFKAKDFLDIQISNTEENYKNETYKKYKESAIFDSDLKCLIHSFDENILNISDNTILEGNLQSESYLKPNIEILNKYIGLKGVNKNKQIKKNTCILNIRGGEYKLHRNLILPKSYWLNAINNMLKINKELEFKIITDDILYASKLLPNYEIIQGGIKEDFINLYFCNYAILSNSTFGYFPVKLGMKPEKVIAPYQWARFGNTKNRWVSPCNYYKDWLWQNIDGNLVDEREINNSIINSKIIYESYNIRTNSEALKRLNFKDLIPSKFKKPVKKLLSKIFPLLIG
ncbi:MULTISPECIES: hypothetical protein [Prochlorococcus]|uniref:Glycosyl transferase n=1 Tax=Prochlorococcus marinus str. MIT 9116 TaxID=167544 RepID=A0A0A1ZY36_PROMR|nr:hypothetical protein [Prochlorococcus marinus]KGF91956.1 glycosyl transferase [Prochlorococcus marinus str. MIT 9107]KGF93043.1 glycosyl transferase [Prochlorococcus marinus str. MIT 9116]KGF93999.1 glycosyl transferase [Prochlorococcus marinus str. MIT 9123]